MFIQMKHIWYYTPYILIVKSASPMQHFAASASVHIAPACMGRRRFNPVEGWKLWRKIFNSWSILCINENFRNVLV